MMEIKDIIFHIQHQKSAYYPDALREVVSLLSRLQTAEIPKRKKDDWGLFNKGYNTCDDQWRPFYLKSMAEKDREIEKLNEKGG